MDIEYEAKKVAARIIEWCFLKDREGLDENLPTKVIEELLKQNEKEIIDKACETYCKVCYNKTTDCKEFCNDVNIFREEMRG